MRIISMTTALITEIPFLNAGRGPGGFYVDHLPIHEAFVDRLPDGVSAIIATGDLQGRERFKNSRSGPPRLLGEILRYNWRKKFFPNCHCPTALSEFSLPVIFTLSQHLNPRMTLNEHSIGKYSPGFVIPAGTQVVLRSSRQVEGGEDIKKAGSVGVVVESPPHNDTSYIVQFADGESVRARFEELSLRRKEVESELSEVSEDLREFVIYRCQVGSKPYGLATEESDDDIRGIYLPPARLHWSLYRLPEQLESADDEQDEVYWELEKFLRLALKANPNVLETLWTPIVLEATEVAIELRSIRAAFLSKHLYKTYSGYVLSQFRRMTNAVKKKGTYKPKHAMHLVRLLLSGIKALKTGEIMIDVSEHREELLNIRLGTLSFEEVKQRALDLDNQFQAAFNETTLAEQPDYAVVDEFLIRARRTMLDA